MPQKKKSDRKLRERNIIVNIKYLRAHKYLIKNMIWYVWYAKGFLRKSLTLKSLKQSYWLRTRGTQLFQLAQQRHLTSVLMNSKKLIGRDGKGTVKAKSAKADLSKAQIKPVYRNICLRIKLQSVDKFSFKMPWLKGRMWFIPLAGSRKQWGKWTANSTGF